MLCPGIFRNRRTKSGRNISGKKAAISFFSVLKILPAENHSFSPAGLKINTALISGNKFQFDRGTVCS